MKEELMQRGNTNRDPLFMGLYTLDTFFPNYSYQSHFVFQNYFTYSIEFYIDILLISQSNSSVTKGFIKLSGPFQLMSSISGESDAQNWHSIPCQEIFPIDLYNKIVESNKLVDNRNIPIRIVLKQPSPLWKQSDILHLKICNPRNSQLSSSSSSSSSSLLLSKKFNSYNEYIQQDLAFIRQAIQAQTSPNFLRDKELDDQYNNMTLASESSKISSSDVGKRSSKKKDKKKDRKNLN